MPIRRGGDLKMAAKSAVPSLRCQGPSAWRWVGVGLSVTAVAAAALLAVFATASPRHSAAAAPVSVPIRALAASSTKRALTLEGGGLLALADFSGATSGLLAVLGRKDGGEATLDGLLNDFDTVSSISGGAWFAAQMAYSVQFQDVLSQMAAEPSKAGIIFKAEWVAKAVNLSRLHILSIPGNVFHCLGTVLSALAPGQPQAHDLPSLVKLLALKGHVLWYFQAFVQVLILFSGEDTITWDSMIDQLMRLTAGIDSSLPLGTNKFNTWARGKRLMFGTSIITPNGTATGDRGLGARVSVFAPGGSEAFSYTAQGVDGIGVPQFIPAKISIVPGVAGSSPEPFCGQEGCFNVSLVYEGEPGGATAQSQPLGDVFHSAFEESAASLPVHSAAAAASAVAYALAVNSFDGSQGCLELAMWGTSAGTGQSFQVGRDLRSDLFADPAAIGDAGDKVRRFADAGLFALGDGVGTDESGLGHALSTGADRITAFLDNDITGFENRLADTVGFRFLQAFPGASGLTSFRTLFSSPSADEFADLYSGFQRMKPAEDTPFLRAIAYGSVECVTRGNPWFGLQEGRAVTLNVLAVETVQITIGQVRQGYSFDSFYDYGTLAGHVAETLAAPEHDEEVRALLVEFFS